MAWHCCSMSEQPLSLATLVTVGRAARWHLGPHRRPRRRFIDSQSPKCRPDPVHFRKGKPQSAQNSRWPSLTPATKFTQKIRRSFFSDGGKPTIHECTNKYHADTAEFGFNDKYGNVNAVSFGGARSASGDLNPIQEAARSTAGVQDVLAAESSGTTKDGKLYWWLQVS